MDVKSNVVSTFLFGWSQGALEADVEVLDGKTWALIFDFVSYCYYSNSPGHVTSVSATLQS